MCLVVALVLTAAVSILIVRTNKQHEHDAALHACEQYSAMREQKIDKLGKKLSAYEDTDFLRYREGNNNYGRMAKSNVRSVINQLSEDYLFTCYANDKTETLRSQLAQQQSSESGLDEGIKEVESAIASIDTMKTMQAKAGSYNMPRCDAIAGNYKTLSTIDREDFAYVVVNETCGVYFVQYTNTPAEDLFNTWNGDLDKVIGDDRPSQELHLDSVEQEANDFGSVEWSATDGYVTACLVAAAPGVPIHAHDYPYSSERLENESYEDLQYMRISMTTECDKPDSEEIYYKSQPDMDTFLKERANTTTASIDDTYDKAYKMCEANAGTYEAQDGTSITLRKDCTTLRIVDSYNEPQMFPFDVTSFSARSGGTYSWGTTGEGIPIIKVVPKGANEGFSGLKERTGQARISFFVTQMPATQQAYDEGILIKKQ